MNVGKIASFVAGVAVAGVTGGLVGGELAEFLPNGAADDFQTLMTSSNALEGINQEEAVESLKSLKNEFPDFPDIWSDKFELSQQHIDFIGEGEAENLDKFVTATVDFASEAEESLYSALETHVENKKAGGFVGATIAGIAGGFGAEALHDKLSTPSTKWQDKIAAEPTSQRTL